MSAPLNDVVTLVQAIKESPQLKEAILTMAKLPETQRVTILRQMKAEMMKAEEATSLLKSFSELEKRVVFSEVLGELQRE